jgi:FKBP-type peptidyl-prolyl cis-trans isomerase FkpA
MMRKSVGTVLIGVVAALGGCQKKEAAPAAVAKPAPTMSEDEKAVYALGAAMGHQVTQQVKALGLTPAEVEVLKKGLADSLAGAKPEFSIEQYGPRLQARAQEHATAAAAGEKDKSRAFREAAEREPGAVRTASGLVFRTIQPGRGASPRATDVVQVNYRGTLTDGTEFDASANHGGPAQFQLNQVIPCWTEGVARMRVGEKARLVCPSEIAYGDRAQGERIPPGATLVFEVELLGIRPGPAAQAGR